YGTGVAELLAMLRRDRLIIGGGGTNRGVETTVREAFNRDMDTVVVRECCWSGDREAHEYSLNRSLAMFARVRTLEQTLAMLRADTCGDLGNQVDVGPVLAATPTEHQVGFEHGLSLGLGDAACFDRVIQHVGLRTRLDDPQATGQAAEIDRRPARVPQFEDLS